MAAGWKKFDMAAVVKANAPHRIFVIRRPNGKINCGIIESYSSGGVILSNGNWTYEVAFADGPAKMFMAFDPPVVDITIGDKQLV